MRDTQSHPLQSSMQTWTQPFSTGRMPKREHKPLPEVHEQRSKGSKSRVLVQAERNHSKVPPPPAQIHHADDGTRICAPCLVGDHEACTGVGCLDHCGNRKFKTGHLAPLHTKVKRSKR